MTSYQDGLLKRFGYSEKRGCGKAELCPAFSLPDLFRSGGAQNRQQISGLLDAVLPRPAATQQAHDHAARAGQVVLHVEAPRLRRTHAREVVGQRCTETRRGQPHHILAPEHIDQRAPDRGSLRIAMYQNHRHGALLLNWPS